MSAAFPAQTTAFFLLELVILRGDKATRLEYG